MHSSSNTHSPSPYHIPSPHSLFGTSDNDDLNLINANIDKLFEGENELKTIIGKQTAFIKKIINLDGLKQVENLANELRTR